VATSFKTSQSATTHNNAAAAFSAVRNLSTMTEYIFDVELLRCTRRQEDTPWRCLPLGCLALIFTLSTNSIKNALQNICTHGMDRNRSLVVIVTSSSSSSSLTCPFVNFTEFLASASEDVRMDPTYGVSPTEEGYARGFPRACILVEYCHSTRILCVVLLYYCSIISPL